MEQSKLKGAIEWVLIIVCAVAVALVFRMFVAEVYIEPSGSMLETIQEGDRLVGEKVSYHFRDPEAGEVVTFDDPLQPGTTLIKRVIATGGQTVELKDGKVYVDGTPRAESYTLGKPSEPLQTPYDITYPYTVPDGCVWVMGDNRTNSKDSRYFGAVPVDSVSSRATFIFWPPSDAKGL